MNLNIAKKIGLPEPTQRNRMRPVKPEQPYNGENPGMFSIEEIIGRPAGRYVAKSPRPKHHNPGIALMYASECIVQPYYHSGHH